ncbi:hypothetical protein XELAEV_18009980mg [Xenopus laevis]|uniref:Uncharacterized protein n=1 Tax=Xenopus laevis TaxID=8355 RepID=A0A974DVR6_XENLA|nr:hypothetical protein XELAEV_18009980mg [Xenopus laevis]
MCYVVSRATWLLVFIQRHRHTQTRGLGFTECRGLGLYLIGWMFLGNNIIQQSSAIRQTLSGAIPSLLSKIDVVLMLKLKITHNA